MIKPVPLLSAIYTTCLLLCLSIAHSQDFIYKHYGLQDGLASPTIHSIFQDRDGFLWIGTESGLCRYDGSQFKTFSTKDGLQGNEVFSMMQDTKGRIWLRQYKNSIAYIYNGKIYNQQNDSTLKKIKLVSRVYGIAEDGEGNIGLCDESSLFIILNDYKTVKIIDKIDGKPLWAVSLSTDVEKRFMLCSNRSLYKIEDYQFKYIKKIAMLGEDMGETAVLLHHNYIPYSANDSTVLIYLKDTTIRYTSLTNFPIKYSVISDSVFSINTTDGAILFNVNSRQGLKILPKIKVSNVFMDIENNLWLGTMDKGLYKMSSRVIINRKVGDTGNEICYITKAGGRIIVGNNSSQVYEYKNEKFIKKTVTAYVAPLGKIHYYEELDSNRCVVANAKGITCYDKNISKHTLYLFTLKHVAQADRKELLLSVNSGLYVARKDNLFITDTIWKRRTLCAFKTGDSILVGTPSGLFILKKNRRMSGSVPGLIPKKWLVTDSLLNSSTISFIKKSADGLVWVSTFEDGLYCFKNGKTAGHFTDTNGLPSNNCRSLYISGNTIWLGTDKGLVKISPNNDGFRFQNYSTSEGLPSDNINSIYVDGNTVYLGTTEGLCFFDQTKIETRSICNLVLTGIKIGDSTVDFKDNYFLRRQQRFAVEFSGVSLRAEKAMTYRYKIKGIDDDWRITSFNSLEFTSLPYGNYELEIVASNKFGKESSPLKVKFTIIRPFHKTIWFIGFLALSGILAILFLYNRWLNRRKQVQLQKLKQEIKFLELEQMALRAQMNPHFIFNCINAMQQLVIENDTENASRFIASFSDLVRQTLDNAPELFIPLEEEIKFLTSYFELERIRLEDRFSYVIDVSSIKNIDQLRVPNMVIQPFAENAIKHGVRYKKDGVGLIEIKFTKENGMLRCIIMDNGIGREKAGQVQKEAGMQHVSKGMGITFRRIESLNTLTNGKVAIAVHDLKRENGNVLGTKVIIDFQELQA